MLFRSLHLFNHRVEFLEIVYIVIIANIMNRIYQCNMRHRVTRIMTVFDKIAVTLNFQELPPIFWLLSDDNNCSHQNNRCLTAVFTCEERVYENMLLDVSSSIDTISTVFC